MTEKKAKSIPAISLKSLGGAAPEFPMPIELTRHDGSTLTVNWTIKGLRKSAWAGRRDEYLKAIRAEDKPAEGEFSFANLVSAGVKEAAELITKAAIGWDLADELTADNIVELEDIQPGVISATLTKIDAALFQGRLGN